MEGLSEDAASKVQKISRNDSLIEVDLRYEFLGDEGAQVIAKSLATNTHLENLRITNNEIGDAGCKALGKAIARNNTLKTLDLSFNDAITNKGASYLLKGLEANTSITQLTLLFNKQIGQDILKDIRKLLERNMSFPKAGREANRKGSVSLKVSRSESHAKKHHKSGSKDRHGRRKSSQKVDEPMNPPEVSISILQNQAEEYKKRIAELEKEVARLREAQTGSNSSGNDTAPQSVQDRTNSVSRMNSRNKEFTLNFNNLLVTEKLAATGGSNAGVYACYVDGWQCAMKELSIENLKLDKNHINNFETEIQLLENLPHNNHIVKYLHHERTRDKIRLFITKYSSTLGNEIRKRKIDVDEQSDDPYTPDEVVRYLLDITSGLKFLHDQNIIHRDLKSDNIFVTLDERKDIATLAIGDFDTAKVLRQGGPAKTLVGTPVFMAPEVLAQEGAYSLKADIYSFGMVIFEILALQLPYSELPPFRITTNILQGISPKLPALGTEYDALVDLFKTCTAREPSKRPTVVRVREILHGLKK
mmetsp:Transcript_18155/g.51206  ORF Transcript_18155/g.51206 Transcript_18155/m.51206 type:complete len:532 (+) Transcript_18155:93-1688(+)